MKKILAAILAIVSIMGLSACSQNPVPEPDSSQPAESTESNEITVTKVGRSFAPIEITGDNVLNSTRLFDTMYEDKNQAMLSPLSLNMCLGMLETGAAGTSKAAFDSYLGNTDYAAFAKSYLEHAKDFSREEDTGSFSKYKDVFEIGNSFWASEQRTFNEDYKKRVAESFGAEIENVDFAENEKAADKINGWVNKKTHQMIPTIVDKDKLGAATAAVLVNTVYFESAWSEDWYVPEEKEKFTNADGSTVNTELMYNGGDSYFENDSATAFSCYYKNGMQFIGILPKKEGDFTLESLDIGSLLKTETRAYNVLTCMPKLNFETDFPLTDALKAAGLSDAFDPAKADFTPMEGEGAERFYISEVVQKTKLELDEEGTRAAAATAATLADTAGEHDEREKKVVYLKRPFAFLIYDGEAEQIVFMGKVTAV